ncbi:hypothetical protein EOA78_31540 [Mesorhizobium sp. M5C.F.Cr.IN.023.01.1.1]|uniref:hypothetical protein n=1 Tax=Mesorhizobium sp. M5C.F.Cr.IN.023.01.1.1 TaxID=2496768 RepID=UPI000FCACC97|nr:hypothetical protein [Mesorhizobium sp. M5C.F.Cr.IN.023.01.1.1]RUV67123.1 hypothetical protein EOA78_31540 [Mesorhizobium sp. M5C.F.Cr.IN.023.01.1.1]
MNDRLTVKEARSGEEDKLDQKAEISQTRAIRAVLRPGDTRSDADRFQRTTYRMFGTDRVLDRFHLDIQALQTEEETEVCQAWGMVSYTSDADFRRDIEPDYVSFTLMVKPSTFEMYARRIAEGTADEVIFGVGMVSGFYSEWSPEVHTRDVKILVPGNDQKVDLPIGIEFEVPRLGRIGEANLYINAKRVLSKPTTNEDDGDEPQTTPLVRPEVVVPQAGIDPQTVKLLQSLKGSTRWIIGLLIVLVIATLLKR